MLDQNTAAWLTKQGNVKQLKTGSDRIAANGDVANKIGTYSVMVNVKYRGVKTMVVAPTSTVNPNTSTSDALSIE